MCICSWFMYIDKCVRIRDFWMSGTKFAAEWWPINNQGQQYPRIRITAYWKARTCTPTIASPAEFTKKNMICYLLYLKICCVCFQVALRGLFICRRHTSAILWATKTFHVTQKDLLYRNWSLKLKFTDPMYMSMELIVILMAKIFYYLLDITYSCCVSKVDKCYIIRGSISQIFYCVYNNSNILYVVLSGNINSSICVPQESRHIV